MVSVVWWYKAVMEQKSVYHKESYRAHNSDVICTNKLFPISHYFCYEIGHRGTLLLPNRQQFKMHRRMFIPPSIHQSINSFVQNMTKYGLTFSVYFSVHTVCFVSK